MSKKRLASIAFVVMLLLPSLTAQIRKFYQEPTWQPRIFLPYDEVIKGDFCPPSPTVPLTYNDPTF
ncbi:MAG: hypothetical protein ACOYM7_09780, partial [Paludibacter sp.]